MQIFQHLSDTFSFTTSALADLPRQIKSGPDVEVLAARWEVFDGRCASMEDLRR